MPEIEIDPETETETPERRRMRRRPVAEFGRQLQAARLAAGYRSGAAAARAAKMAQANWWRYEMTDRPPYWKTVRRLILTLGLPLECFLPDAAILAAADRIRTGQAVRVPEAEPASEPAAQ